MADIFISYAREDAALAQSLAVRLERNGWSVWWDRKIVPGKVFDAVITRELAASRCVLVLWSRHSVNSDWVKEEATEGAQRGVLVPAFLDETAAPLGFKRIQAASLAGWSGDIGDDRLNAIQEAILEYAPLHTPTGIKAIEVSHLPESGGSPPLPTTSAPQSYPVSPRVRLWMTLVSFVAGYLLSALLARALRSMGVDLLFYFNGFLYLFVWVFVSAICQALGLHVWRKFGKGP